jgi:hypothetical protein
MNGDKMSEAARQGEIGAPTEAQRAFLQRGLRQPGRKLPLFGDDGQPVDPLLIRICIAQGWAERWFRNPIAPDWLVCRLTDDGAAAAVRTLDPPHAEGVDAA